MGFVWFEVQAGFLDFELHFNPHFYIIEMPTISIGSENALFPALINPNEEVEHRLKL